MDVLLSIAADSRGGIIQFGQNVLSPNQITSKTKKRECTLLFDCLVLFYHTFCAHCLLGNGFFLGRVS